MFQIILEMKKSSIFILFFIFLVGGKSNFLLGQVKTGNFEKTEDTGAKINSDEYARMLNESFLAEMNPGQNMMAFNNPIENQVLIQKSSVIADESGDYKELLNRGESVVREFTRVDYPGFPKFVDTGNPEMDEATYQILSQKWANAHPEDFQKISGNGKNFNP